MQNIHTKTMKIFTKLIALIHHASPAVQKRLFLICCILFVSHASIGIIVLLASSSYHMLLGLTTLSYGLGLRHAVDADHIAAIDNTTRKLMQEGKRPVGVGFFFSLGHSTVVFILSILVALSASFVQHSLPTFKETEALIGTSVSSLFLFLIGIVNLIALIEILNVWRHIVKHQSYTTHELHHHLHQKGFLTRLLKPILKAVSQSWHMYFVGFLFGLGFDTASEVALLSISAATGANSMPFLLILLLPLSFTASMAIIDTLDGILMLGAYGWAYVKPIRKLYYNLNITFLSVIIALSIGGVEALQILSGEFHWNGEFFRFINTVDFGNLGYVIILMFAASFGLSLLIYKAKRYDLLESKGI